MLPDPAYLRISDPRTQEPEIDVPPGHPFAGPGEMRTLCRRQDWNATDLGPVESWSPTLRAAVRMCLESPFPINLWCGSELVLIYNDAYRHVLGSKHPEALGRPGREVWGEIWSQIEPWFDRIREGGDPVYAEDAPFVVARSGEVGDAASDGPNAWFTFSLSGVRDERGEVVAFLNVVSESTGRVLAERETEAARARAERAERRLLDIFTQAPAFMAVLRGEGLVFEYANQAYRELVGRDELVGRSLLDALPELDGQGFDELLSEVIRTGEPYVGREVPVSLTRTPGEKEEQRFVDFVYYPLTDDLGAPVGVVAHGSDVTDHVRARHEAVAARAEAEEANHAKSRFLANMSHELRTPINAVIGYADLLDMEIAGSLNDEQRSQLGRIEASSRHLLMLIDDILDLAKVESGSLAVVKKREPVAAAVSAAIDLVAPQAEAEDIDVRVAASDEDAFFVGDADRVRQILVNLLSNAVKFTPSPGEVRLEQGRAGSPDEAPERLGHGPLVFIRVTDTGIGIPSEHHEAIFEPFSQVDPGDTREHGGTGLGLSISRQLARLMEGDLTVTSEAGEGSSFTLWLPAAPGE